MVFIAIVIESPPGAFGSIIAFAISYHVHLLLLEFGSRKDPGELEATYLFFRIQTYICKIKHFFYSIGTKNLIENGLLVWPATLLGSNIGRRCCRCWFEQNWTAIDASKVGPNYKARHIHNNIDIIHLETNTLLQEKLFQEAESGSDNFNSSFTDVFPGGNADYFNQEDADTAAQFLIQWLSLLPIVAALGLFWLERMLLTLLDILITWYV